MLADTPAPATTVPTAPQSVWPITTTSGTSKKSTANSTEPSTDGVKVFPAVRTQNRSPKPQSNIISSGSRASEQASIAAFHEDQKRFCAMLMDPARSLTARFAWGQGQTLMREALLIADHNAYHVGEIVAVRRALGVWG